MKKSLHVYTDGSHLKHGSGRLGIGGVLVDYSYPNSLPGALIDEFSEELPTALLKSKFGPGAETCSNPTAELAAVLFALKKFGKYFKGVDEIYICADYIGVREWMTGAWKVKEPYIQNIKDQIQSEIKKLGITNKVKYKWVKGHQKSSESADAFWNNRCDLLAKGEIDNE